MAPHMVPFRQKEKSPEGKLCFTTAASRLLFKSQYVCAPGNDCFSVDHRLHQGFNHRTDEGETYGGDGSGEKKARDNVKNVV
jgi:hypothetical protein